MFLSILLRALFALSLVVCSTAIPLYLDGHEVSPSYAPSINLSRIANAMPQSLLPAPTGQLKFVVLGVGTQNYTCSTKDENDAPRAVGAIATLYDIGSSLNDDNTAALKIKAISGLALSLVPHAVAFQIYLKSQGYNHVIGEHYFNLMNQTITPKFALNRLAQSPYPIAKVTKANSTDAPKSAHPGLAREGAVPWLYLVDRYDLSVGGVDTVYRLETAGGLPPVTCKGQPPSFEVYYAAQYWIFGPKMNTLVR